MLRCAVRGCREHLQKDQNRLHCSKGHSFDIARSGYINLLQPQDRRARNPGDTAEAIAARRRLHDKGITEPLRQAIARILAATSEDTILDAGCGDGFYLGTLRRETSCSAHGIDISIPAIDAAARRYPACEWVVANADRTIPYPNGAFSILQSITGRMNPEEFRRVLQDTGRLLIAVPAPDDLIELRGKGRDRVPRTLETFTPAFTLVEQRRVTTRAGLDAAAVGDLLLSIYRPLQPAPPQAMQVTLSLDLLLLQPSVAAASFGN
jgi:23S rRNA (guanine745-N1)-methyltransferase